MFLNDAIGKTPGIKYVCCHHEQACAMAAEGYSRVSNKVGVVNVTTGPGTINTLNGVFGAYTDSIPMLIISGQNKRETILPTYNLPGLRQLGEQEADIIGMVRGITKYAVLVTDPSTIRYHLERALHLAVSGRPGPTWLDIPVDVSSTIINPDDQKAYDPREDNFMISEDSLRSSVSEIIARFSNAKRPSIMIGSGVRISNSVELFEHVSALLGVPVTTAFTAHDAVASDNPLLCGRPGSVGDRPGNFTVQSSDVILVLGSRLNIRQASYNWQNFARDAYKIQVDIDEAELKKPTVRCDLNIRCDIKVFLLELERQLSKSSYNSQSHRTWLAWCRERVRLYPVVTNKMKTAGSKINPYVFLDHLIKQLGPSDVIVCGNASACVISFQTAYIKKGMRLFSNSGSASMGYDLPASIGAAFASGGNRVICLAGDGSAMFNIQELQTIAHHRLPIKIFIINNEGYLSMRTTQVNFFKGNLIGEGPRSGVTFPDFVRLGEAFAIPSIKIANQDFQQSIVDFLKLDGPGLAEIVVDPDQPFEPKLAAKQLPDGKIISPSLEDMWPFLQRDELETNMIRRSAS